MGGLFAFFFSFLNTHISACISEQKLGLDVAGSKSLGILSVTDGE